MRAILRSEIRVPGLFLAAEVWASNLCRAMSSLLSLACLARTGSVWGAAPSGLSKLILLAGPISFMWLVLCLLRYSALPSGPKKSLSSSLYIDKGIQRRKIRPWVRAGVGLFEAVVSCTHRQHLYGWGL